jgi:hypothetical protein
VIGLISDFSFLGMSHFLRVRVKTALPEKLVLELADGGTMEWPRSPEDHHLQNLSAGDELTLTLSAAAHILNDLLNPNPHAKIQHL